jgi:hypothetical protein
MDAAVRALALEHGADARRTADMINAVLSAIHPAR